MKEHGLAEFADVFTEDSVFNYEQSKKYLECAKACGFDLKIHADEIEAIGGSVLAGEMGAVSCEHLIAINEEGLTSMAKAGNHCNVSAGHLFLSGGGLCTSQKDDRNGHSGRDGIGL